MITGDTLKNGVGQSVKSTNLLLALQPYQSTNPQTKITKITKIYQQVWHEVLPHTIPTTKPQFLPLCRLTG